MADAPERDQRTEEATPRRREEAREKGQVAMSTELIAAVTLALWFGALLLYGPSFVTGIGEVVASGLAVVGVLGVDELDHRSASDLLGEVGGDVLMKVAILTGPILLGAMLVGYGQIGFRIAPKAISFDPARINPIKGVGRLFSARSAVRATLALAKVLFIAGSMTAVAWLEFDTVLAMDAFEVGPALESTLHVVVRCTIAALIAIAILALADFGFQRFQHDRDLRMSKQEVRDELKQTEGDPHLKGRIRQAQRELASQRMMQEVPDATVVVTNPTHYAVALRYEREDDPQKQAAAPRVVAKGVDFLAQRIKEVAREAGVVIYEDVALARTLHAQCEVGDEIPVDLYRAVAGVLAYVYRIQGVSAPA